MKKKALRKENVYTLSLSNKGHEALRKYKILHKEAEKTNITFSQIINNLLESKAFKKKYEKLESKLESTLIKKLEVLKHKKIDKKIENDENKL